MFKVMDLTDLARKSDSRSINLDIWTRQVVVEQVLSTAQHYYERICVYDYVSGTIQAEASLSPEGRTVAPTARMLRADAEGEQGQPAAGGFKRERKNGAGRYYYYFDVVMVAP